MALSTIHTPLMYARYTKTSDVAIDPSKTYYVLNGLFVEVASPVAADLDKYYEKGAWQKFICIKDYPDLTEQPEEIETTTLCNEEATKIGGVKQSSLYQFTCNYSKDEYGMILDLKDELISWGLWFGADTGGNPDGHDGKFEWQGKATVSVKGGGVNEVREMTLYITKETDIIFE